MEARPNLDAQERKRKKMERRRKKQIRALIGWDAPKVPFVITILSSASGR